MSDHCSNIPIRDVSHKKDPKPDPNIETKTYGLFSYCCRVARKGIVKRGIKYQFFCTARRDAIRVLTGYYRTGWYFEVRDDDFMIAAEYCRFVSPGFPLSELAFYLEGCPMGTRDWRYIPETAAARLLSLIDEAPNATGLYRSEVRRLERWSLQNHGHVYRNRTRGFGWADAPGFMGHRSR